MSFVGKGFDPGDAVRRCLGEMAEFHSWLYDPRRIERGSSSIRLGQGCRVPWSCWIAGTAGRARIRR